MKNPILDELHAVRRQLLEESGGTIAGLTERLRREQADSGRPLYDPADDNLASSQIPLGPLASGIAETSDAKSSRNPSRSSRLSN